MFNYREDFPMLEKNIIYFDNGATTFKPKSVINAMNDYYFNYSANAHRGDYTISYKVDVAYLSSRKKVAEFINAEFDEVVFTSGTTDSINIVAEGFFKNLLEPGDEILLTKSEHASNILPWFRLANTNNCIINYIELDDSLHITMDNVKKAITDKTKLISIAGITNVVGDLRPIDEICKYAHSKNIFVIVDGAQLVPHKKVDVKKSDIDFLAFSGHKMCGPTGIGVLYGKKEFLDKLTPINLGGGMNESFDNENEIYLKELPNRLEAGTPNIAGAIGLGAAIDYLNNIGMDNIEIYENKLKSYLIDKLIKIPFIDIINIESDSGIVSFNIDGIFSQDVAFYLNKYNICVRAGNHCAKILKSETGVKNSIRVSLYFYNTFEEIDKFVELISDKEKIMKEMIM
ncbi:MAG: cysteine desulfurase [Bacilli bacterium]|nr:cysteine desulfurase [Bacilli bacterium]